MSQKRATGFCKIDVLIIVDFIVNILLCVVIFAFYQSLYSKTGSANFMESMLYAGNGTFLIAFVTSLLITVIEFIYGVLRLKGKGPYETGNLRNWAMMWFVLKIMILFFGVIISFFGVDLNSFLNL